MNTLQAGHKVNMNFARYGYSPQIYRQIIQPNENVLLRTYRNATKRNVSRSTSPGIVRRMTHLLTPKAGGKNTRTRKHRAYREVKTNHGRT